MIVPLLFIGVLLTVPESDQFQDWFVEDGVQVEIVRQKDTHPWIRGTAELDVSAEKVGALIRDYKTYTDTFGPHLSRATILASQDQSARLHMVWDMPFPLKDRDAIVFYEFNQLDDNTALLTWRDDEKEGDPKKGRRIEKVQGDTRIESLGPDRCRVIYTYFGDLGGRFTKFIREKAWRGEPLTYFKALRKGLGLKSPS